MNTTTQTPARALTLPAPARSPRAEKQRSVPSSALVLGDHPSYWPVGEAAAAAGLPRLTVQQTRPHPSGPNPSPRAGHRADHVRDRGAGDRRRDPSASLSRSVHGGT